MVIVKPMGEAIMLTELEAALDAARRLHSERKDLKSFMLVETVTRALTLAQLLEPDIVKPSEGDRYGPERNDRHAPVANAAD